MPSIRLPLYYRLLFPELIEAKNRQGALEAPPKITQSSSIDQELYIYLALIIRDFILPWYQAITLDYGLSKEVTRIVSPHFAVRNEKEYIRQLSDHLLKCLLPKEEYESDCVRYLVRDILAMVLTIITSRLSDPWTINTIICKLLSRYDARLKELQAPGEIWSKPDFPEPTVRPESKSSAVDVSPNGIVPLIDEAQNTTIGSHLRHRHVLPSHTIENQNVTTGMVDLKRNATPTIPYESSDDPSTTLPPPQKPPRRYSMRFISLQVLLAPLQSMWLYLMSLFTASQEQYQYVVRQRKKSKHVRLEEPLLRFAEVALSVEEKPVVLWAWRMIGMFIWPIVRMLGVGIFLDKFLEQSVYHLLSEQRIVYYLQMGRETLWPGGKFMTAAPTPTEEEQQDLRIQAERKLVLALPDIAERLLFETSDVHVHQECMNQALVPLQNAQINKHLVFLIVDLIVTTLFPELASPESSLPS
ncbi:hypothetical protein NQZ79_g6993 [Umbelopsis isabellina]|nr:hypothetical protein NQZ79_g6993 [Umbelopsis isabellina]